MRCPFEVRRGTLARSLEAYERRRQAARDRHLSLQAPTRRTQNPGTSPLDSQGGMRRLARRRVEDEAYADDLVHHMANLRSGSKFDLPLDCGSERLAAVCRGTYGFVNHHGYHVARITDRRQTHERCNVAPFGVRCTC